MDLYTKPGVVSTVLEGNTIIVTWTKLYDANEIYASCNIQLEKVKSGKANLVIIDISNANGTPPQECQEWFGKVLFPGYAENKNFKGLINVLPKDAVAKMGANRWKKTAGMFGFNTYEAESVDIAKDLASKL